LIIPSSILLISVAAHRHIATIVTCLIELVADTMDSSMISTSEEQPFHCISEHYSRIEMKALSMLDLFPKPGVRA
jgi:hypothetical protein